MSDEVLDPFAEGPSPAEVAAGRGELEARREEAILRGKALGADEAARRRETGEDREQRIARAAAYAAWEFDGKPLGKGEAYREEFGVRGGDEVVGSLERPRQRQKA